MKRRSITETRLWTGLAEVRQRPGTAVLMDRNEAIVNVVGVSESKSAFEARVQTACDSLGFDLVELEDVESLAARAGSRGLSDLLETLAHRAEESGEIEFGPFHTWRSP